MDPRGRRHERGTNWTDPEIAELLQLWSDASVQVELESSLRNQRVFDRIAGLLRERGVYRTGDQCREKIKKMKLEYRRIKDNYKMKTWKFYDALDRVLASRPAAVIAQQSPAGPDPYARGVPDGPLGPGSSGGVLFGQPLKTEEELDIKREDSGEDVFGSGDDRDANGQSVVGPEGLAGAPVSPPGVSGPNTSSAGGPLRPDTPEEPRKVSPRPSASVRHRRRRQEATRSRRGGVCCNHGRLDRAMAGFLAWQRSAEERLLSLEEARLEREFRAEERREQREERRAERERQHELRLLSVLTRALAAVRQNPPTAAGPAAGPAPSSSPPPPQAVEEGSGHAPSLPQVPPEPLAEQVTSVQESLQAPVEPREMSQPVPATPAHAEGPGRSELLSRRGTGILYQPNILLEGFNRYLANRFHRTENPEGIINLGTSENKLCYDLLHKRLTRPDMLHVDPSLLEYGDTSGHKFLREEAAKFLTHYCRSPRPLKADNVVVMNGCASLLSSVTAAICDPKDVILIPTPFYGSFKCHVGLYGDVELFHVHLDCETDGEGSRPFQLTVEKLDKGLEKAKQEGLNVRGLILTNPHNPLADIYTLKEMSGFLEFAKRNQLHVIIDEIYMLSVFDDAVGFQSVLSMERLPDPERTHVLWGFSKDFAMSGIRFATLHTENADLLKVLAALGNLHSLPGSIQHQAAQLLRNREWINEEFLPENRSRLKAAHRYMTGELRAMGVPFLDRPAALFVWVDLRKFLREPSFEEEFSLWRRFIKHRVLLSCGQAFFCSTPGWFRFLFSERHDRLQLGLKRIREALKEAEDDMNGSKNPVKVNTADSDAATTVSSIPSPESKPSDLPKEKDDLVPDPALPNSVESLIGTLREQMRSSDWLEKNTPELSAGEDPEVLDVFKALLQRAGK